MKKLVKVNHVVLTLKLSPNGQGMERDQVDELVNRRLSEGYDDVEIFPVKNNLDERNQTSDLVQLYIFKRYIEDVSAEAKAKKA